MRNANSSKVADMSNILPGEMDDFNPSTAFDDEDYEDAERILSADEEFLAYLYERFGADVDDQLNRDSVDADE